MATYAFMALIAALQAALLWKLHRYHQAMDKYHAERKRWEDEQSKTPQIPPIRTMVWGPDQSSPRPVWDIGQDPFRPLSGRRQ